MKSDALMYKGIITACKKGQQWSTAMTLIRKKSAVAHEVRHDQVQGHHQCM